MRANITSAILILACPLLAQADDDHHRPRRDPAQDLAVRADPAFATYSKECGACHLAYPPGLLPARSWARLLDGLADHFGEDAALGEGVRAELGGWLARYAAESDSHRLSRRVRRSARGSTPLRPSELRFIAHEHDELRPAVWARPAVGSVANCGACHTGAEAWDFSERGLRIPKSSGSAPDPQG